MLDLYAIKLQCRSWRRRLPNGSFDAEEALRISYVSRVVPADQFLPAVREFAARLAQGPAVAIQLSKRLLYRSLEADVDQALEMAESAMVLVQTTEDAREGPRAFVEKRPPKFTSR